MLPRIPCICLVYGKFATSGNLPPPCTHSHEWWHPFKNNWKSNFNLWYKALLENGLQPATSCRLLHLKTSNIGKVETSLTQQAWLHDHILSWQDNAVSVVCTQPCIPNNQEAACHVLFGILSAWLWRIGPNIICLFGIGPRACNTIHACPTTAAVLACACTLRGLWQDE